MRKSVFFRTSLAVCCLSALGSRVAPVRASQVPNGGELPASRTSLSVVDAYRAIPHRRTVFRFERSPILDREKTYLSEMFDLIDRGVVLRVALYRSFMAGEPDGDSLVEDLGLLVNYFETKVIVPEGLRDYHAQVVAAMKAQKAFFEEWRDAGAGFPFSQPRRLPEHPLVQKSSRALRTAYGMLMRRYGAREDRENRDAFFDYHCALDFL